MKDTLNIKGLDLLKIIAELQDAIKKDGVAAVRVQNDNYAPTIQKGDKVKIVRVKKEEIQSGDLVLFITDDVNVRKVTKVSRNGKGTELSLTNGRGGKDIIMPAGSIIGRVIEAKRGSEKIKFGLDLSGSNLLKADLGTIISRFFKKKK